MCDCGRIGKCYFQIPVAVLLKQVTHLDEERKCCLISYSYNQLEKTALIIDITYNLSPAVYHHSVQRSSSNYNTQKRVNHDMAHGSDYMIHEQRARHEPDNDHYCLHSTTTKRNNMWCKKDDLVFFESWVDIIISSCVLCNMMLQVQGCDRWFIRRNRRGSFLDAWGRRRHP